MTDLLLSLTQQISDLFIFHFHEISFIYSLNNRFTTIIRSSWRPATGHVKKYQQQYRRGMLFALLSNCVGINQMWTPVNAHRARKLNCSFGNYWLLSVLTTAFNGFDNGLLNSEAVNQVVNGKLVYKHIRTQSFICWQT